MTPEDGVPAGGAGRRVAGAAGEAARGGAPGRAGRGGASRAGLAVLLGAMAAWGGWFIYRTSFVADGRRVFCLFDDAMISMTYARNLVEGYGLNWARQGAPVEGFTHPLWTALMVPVNALPIGLERRSLVVQLVSLALLLANVVLVRRLVLRHFTRPGARHWAPACVLTAFYYPLVFWSLVGMETGLQAVLTTALALLALDAAHGRRDRHLALGLTGTLAVLLRLDMVPLVAAAQIYVLAHGGLRRINWARRVPTRRAGPGARRRWLWGLAMPVAAIAGYTLFRQVYFHDLLPNTYYLKLQGIPLAVRLLRGGDAMLDTIGQHWPLLLAVAVGVAPQLVLPRGRLLGRRPPPAAVGREEQGGDGDLAWGSRLALPAAVFAICCAYSVYVGGDAWEEVASANRFVAFAMPMVFVLFNALANQALAAVRRRGLAARAEDAAQRGALGAADGEGLLDRLPDPLAVRCGLLAATVAALVAANGLWPSEDAAEGWKKLAAVSRPTEADKYREVLGLVRTVQKFAAASATVAVTWAGTPAYFSDFRMVDTLGYNDRHIAREKPARELTEDNFEDYVPGHAKWDYDYLLDKRRPDVFLQTWGGQEVAAALTAHGYRRIGELWIDPASPRIRLAPAVLAAKGAR